MKKYLLLLISIQILLYSCSNKERIYTIGVSQCSEDIWRNKLNRELKTSEYFNESIKFEFRSASDNDKKQIKQIDDLIRQNVDLLIISPNQINSITNIVEKAYNLGIPVILFDRKADTDKYTAFIGGNNYIIGKTMAEYIASNLKNNGKVVEIGGLKGSSPAQDRHKGFTDEIHKHLGIEVITTEWGNWSELSGEESMQHILQKYKGPIDYVFCQNDRMAFGARKTLLSTKRKQYLNTKFIGIDGLATKNGGIESVLNNILDASYIYPTEGDEVAKLALNILKHKPYKRINFLKSSIVTTNNAEVLLMQAKDIERQTNYLDILHAKVTRTSKILSEQKVFLTLSSFTLLIFIIVIILGYHYYIARIRLKEEQEKINENQLSFFTNMSHKIRTPLSLVADPIAHIVNRGYLEESDFNTLKLTYKNTERLMILINNILDFKQTRFDEVGTHIDINKQLINDNETPKTEDITDSQYKVHPIKHGNTNTILVVDDNDDIREYIDYILKTQYQVLTAKDGQAGLYLALKTIPDLIISDIMMPNMNGLELCKQLKTNTTTCHIPVILLTAKSQEEQIVEGYESGADSYIIKPFNSKILLAYINNVLQVQERWHEYFTNKSLGNSIDEQDNTSYEIEKISDFFDNTHFAMQINFRDKEFICHFHDIIQKNLAVSSLSIDTIGKEIGLSRIQLYRKIKALTGSSPVELLRKTRLKQAHKLLLEDKLDISEVAYKVGFNSPSYFSKCFKEEFGLQPSEVHKK